MAERRTISSERGDDIAVLLAQLEQMGVQPLPDEHCPTYGNWVGLSLGSVSVVWLTHMRSEADHRRKHRAPGARLGLPTLRRCTEQPVHPLDIGNDRLAGVLEALRDAPR